MNVIMRLKRSLGLLGCYTFGLPPLTWEEFTEVFMMRFLSFNKKEKYVADFERLRQTPGMSIAEYEEQFTNLSCYADHLVSNDTMKARRFVRGIYVI